MLNINRIMVTGRITRNPETRSLASGTMVANFGIAVNRNYQSGSGEWKEETIFLDIEAWGRLAERAMDTSRFYKGRPVYVEGRLKIDEWERDGVKRQTVRINADNISVFDVPKAGARDDAPVGGEAENPFARNTTPYSGRQQADTPLPTPGVSPSAKPSDGLDWGKSAGSNPPSTENDIPF